jgi:hypothetical protein
MITLLIALIGIAVIGLAILWEGNSDEPIQ